MLWDLRQGADEDSEDVVVFAEPCDDIDFVEEVSLDFRRDLEDGEWETGRCWRSHCWIKEEGGRQTLRMDRLNSYRSALQ